MVACREVFGGEEIIGLLIVKRLDFVRVFGKGLCSDGLVQLGGLVCEERFRSGGMRSVARSGRNRR